MEPILALRTRGIPVELFLTLPLIIACLYPIFRWRKFGEDGLTWNHEYFKLASSFGGGVLVATFLANLLPETWHVAVFWVVLFIGAVLALGYWCSMDVVNASILSVLMIVVGVLAMPVPRLIRHFLFGAPKPAPTEVLAEVPAHHFALKLPDGWKELPGKTPRTYSCQAEGSGVFQLSLQPPSEPPITTGAEAEKELSQLLESVGQKMNLGQRVALSHEECAAGIMAFADYETEQHGRIRFWLIPAEATIFASYTDGGPKVTERETAQAHQALKVAEFE